jgi:hypothetical protein
MTGMLPLLLGLLVAAVLGIALLELLIRRADVAAVLIFGSVVVQAYFDNMERIPALALPGGVKVYLTDMVASLILGAAVLRLLRLPSFDRFLRWLLLLGVLLLVSLVRGLAAFGMQHSIADFRQSLFFGGVAVYFATFSPAVRLYDRIGRITPRSRSATSSTRSPPSSSRTTGSWWSSTTGPPMARPSWPGATAGASRRSPWSTAGCSEGTRRHATPARAPLAASCWPIATPTTSSPPAGSRP